jgi:hypothetical protein
MPDEEEDELINTLKFMHKMFIGIIKFVCSSLKPVRMLCYVSLLCTAALGFIVRSELDVPNFATRRLNTCHHARAPSGGRRNCGREMSGNFA